MLRTTALLLMLAWKAAATAEAECTARSPVLLQTENLELNKARASHEDSTNASGAFPVSSRSPVQLQPESSEPGNESAKPTASEQERRAHGLRSFWNAAVLGLCVVTLLGLAAVAPYVFPPASGRAA
mmetsp:Transcript_800/g.1531  ORF Transcript_800/g.1531 Transcript_800/m.1531 type:complete len:127 (-) Transcript_800:83-463(-)